MKKTGYVMLFLLLVGGALALAQETTAAQAINFDFILDFSKRRHFAAYIIF